MTAISMQAIHNQRVRTETQGSVQGFPAVRRAAFDLGSGKFKLLVADVQGQNIDVKFSKTVSVGLGEDFACSNDQTLSNGVEKVAVAALRELKKDAQGLGATEFQGIATAVFRRARNGEAFLGRLAQESGVTLRTVPQEKEGLIGFYTALALSPSSKEQDIISWDSGNASFQITTKNDERYEVYEGPLGNSVVLKVLMEEVRKVPYNQTDPINPIAPSEREALIKAIQDKITLPDWLRNKISNKNTSIVTIGDHASIFGIAAKGIGSNRYTIDQVRGLLEEMTGKSTKELKRYVGASSTKATLTRIILLYAVMEKFGIREVTFKESTGSTLGLMVDQELWSKLPKRQFLSKM